MKRRFPAAILLALVMAAFFFFPVEADAEAPLLEVSPTYQESVYYQRLQAVKRSGDYRADLVNIALSQVGYHEGNSKADYGGGNAIGCKNYTEYASVYWGYDAQWCAMFVSWCARQAGIPYYMLNNAARAAADWVGGPFPNQFHIATNRPADYTPVPGDLVFFTYDGYNSAHVGVVAQVTERGIRTVEGNCSNAVRIKEYAFDSPVLLRYGVFCNTALTAPISEFTTTELIFASDRGGDHGMLPENSNEAYSFHKLYAMDDTAFQMPTRAFCRDGYTLAGYYVRRCYDGRWLSTEKTWVTAEEIRSWNARPYLLYEGISVQWTGAWTGAPQLQLHCVWKNAAGLLIPDATAAQLRTIDSEGWQNPFCDLTKNYWYYADVRAAEQAGLLPYTDVFDGWRAMTRGEFVVMLYRLAGSPAVEDTAVFTDLGTEDEVARAASWATAAGVVKGVSGARFDPCGELSREQAVTMLCRLRGGAPTGSAAAPEFADAGAVSSWARDAVTWAAEQELLRGISRGDQLLLLPQKAMTRPEGVALICRAAGLSA